MNTRNIIRLTGRLTEDPSFVITKEGKEFQAKFSIAVSRNYKNKNGEVDADFIPCRLSREARLKTLHQAKKGHWIDVIGELRTDSYMKDGSKIYTWWIELDDWQWLPYNTPADETNKMQGNASNSQHNGQQNMSPFPGMNDQMNHANHIQNGQYPNQGFNQSYQQGGQAYPNNMRNQMAASASYSQNQYGNQSAYQSPYPNQNQNQNGSRFPDDDIFNGLSNVKLPV